MIVEKKICIDLPTEFGVFRLCYYLEVEGDKEHLVLIMGEVAQKSHVLTRVHSECLTGDLFGSRRCDCGEQLERSMRLIGNEGCGAIIYLRQEGRGIGLLDKLRAYKLQEQGYDTVDANLELGHQADERTYDVAAHILDDLEVRSVDLLTNNPAKVKSLRALGINVAKVIAMQPTICESNRCYIETKVNRFGHKIVIDHA